MPRRDRPVEPDKGLIRVAGYDPEGRRRVVCSNEDESEALAAAGEEAEYYILLHRVAEPLSKWEFRIE